MFRSGHSEVCACRFKEVRGYIKVAISLRFRGYDAGRTGSERVARVVIFSPRLEPEVAVVPAAAHQLHDGAADAFYVLIHMMFLRAGFAAKIDRFYEVVSVKCKYTVAEPVIAHRVRTGAARCFAAGVFDKRECLLAAEFIQRSDDDSVRTRVPEIRRAFSDARNSLLFVQLVAHGVPEKMQVGIRRKVGTFQYFKCIPRTFFPRERLKTK